MLPGMLCCCVLMCAVDLCAMSLCPSSPRKIDFVSVYFDTLNFILLAFFRHFSHTFVLLCAVCCVLCAVSLLSEMPTINFFLKTVPAPSEPDMSGRQQLAFRRLQNNSVCS